MEIKSPTQEALFVSDLLLTSAGSSSRLIDSFSGWLLGGYGVVTTLFLSQYDSMSKHLSIHTFKLILLLFGLTVLLGSMEKYIAMLVTSAATGAEGARDARSRHNLNEPIARDFIFSEMEKAFFYPGKWYVHRSFERAKSGDIVTSARRFMKGAQIQGMILLCQLVVIVATAWMVAIAFHF